MKEENKRYIYLEKRIDGSLFPVDAESAESWTDIQPGKYLFTYTAKKKLNRNVYFHRKFFKMIKTVFDNQERFQTSEQLRKAVLIEAGFYHPLYTFEGIIKEADSVAFHKMSQEEFETVYSKCVDVCIKSFGYDENMFTLLMSFI